MTLAHDTQNDPLPRLTDGDIMNTRNQLALIREEKKRITAQERDVIKAFKAKGGNTRALSIVRSLASIEDSEERDAAIAHLESYLLVLKYT